MRSSRWLQSPLLPTVLVGALLGAEPSPLPPATSSFAVTLPPHPFAGALLPDSPFGINMALGPDTPDLNERLDLMQAVGIKWGRQDFAWRRIEREKGTYEFEPYERLVVECRKHGILIFGCLGSAPRFHDPRTPEGVNAYADFCPSNGKPFRGQS